MNTTIGIVHLLCRGVMLHIRLVSYRLGVDPSSEYRRGCCHDTSLTAPSLVLGSRLFELGPLSESGRFFRCRLKRCETSHQAQLDHDHLIQLDHNLRPPLTFLYLLEIV